MTGRDARARERNPNTNVSPCCQSHQGPKDWSILKKTIQWWKGGAKSMYIEFTCGDFAIFGKRITSIRDVCRQYNRKYGKQFESVCQPILAVEIQGPTWHVRLISVIGHWISVGRKNAFCTKREEHTTLPTQLRTYNGRAESHSWNIAADRERGTTSSRRTEYRNTKSTFLRYHRSRYHEPAQSNLTEQQEACTQLEIF